MTSGGKSSETDERPSVPAAKGRARQRHVALRAAVVTLLVVAGLLVATVRIRASREWVADLLRPREARDLLPVPGLRDVILADRLSLVRSGQLPAAARLNALLAQEAYMRANGVHTAWLARRDAHTMLYPQSSQRPEWNYRNTAADFFAFHLHAGLLIRPDSMPSLTETLKAEGRLRTAAGLCQPVHYATGKPVDVDHDELLFGSSEYAKDGLLSIYERHGPEVAGRTTVAIVDAIIAQSPEQSRYGALPGEGAEINGNLLQLCGRLSYAEGRDDYAEFAARIVDATVFQAMAANGGLPPLFYDFSEGRVRDSTLNLKDHGNEIMLGLAEAYAMAVERAGRGQARWTERARGMVRADRHDVRDGAAKRCELRRATVGRDAAFAAACVQEQSLGQLGLCAERGDSLRRCGSPARPMAW